MIHDEGYGGGGFAEVRDGHEITPVIRPPRDSVPED